MPTGSNSKYPFQSDFKILETNDFISYAEVMELNVWLNSTIEPNPVYDDKTATWSVNVIKDGTIRNLRVAHLVRLFIYTSFKL